MLLPLLLRQAAACRAAPKMLLHHPAEHHFLRRRLPPRLHAQSRNRKSKSGQQQQDEWRTRNKTALTYIAAAGVGMIGLSYAAVPLYRLYCQASGLGGTAVAGHDVDQVETMTPVKERIIKVTFNADRHASMQWNFKPQQTEIFVVPGETALAFYRAKNPTDKPIIGISPTTWFLSRRAMFLLRGATSEPARGGRHMPVFFYIDPEFDEDPRMARVDTITLSYTFFEAKEGQKLPLPGYSYN
ncbi:Cytochrome c oxidase assembly protein COX11 [Nibea albiflora]|nr:Cytochrome c oxidase assembly protein COX11 [Nibea albiflora]